MLPSYVLLFVISSVFLIYLLLSYPDFNYVQSMDDVVFLNSFDNSVKIVNSTDATVRDPNLKIDVVYSGIKFPTSMAFLAPNDILVLEKGEGTVKRIVNGSMLDTPLLDVNVAHSFERGMLGIAISKHQGRDGNKPDVYVFLYYTETKSKDGEDLKGGVMLGNRLYRYELVNNKLINPKLLLDLPVEQGDRGKKQGEHQGGVLLIGPDNNVYLTIGDVNEFTQTQNTVNGPPPNGTGGILRITQAGKPVGKGILGDTYPLNLYYAYGIRNSFGIDFDPLTGNLWDTENGLNCCDEINLVEPGFNSGWNRVQGFMELNQSNRLEQIGLFDENLGKENLIDFDGKGKYSSPEFTWRYTVGPTAIKFLNSVKLGKQYENDIFVGNVNHQNLYHFDLTKDRRELLVDGEIINKTLSSYEDPESMVFATGLGRITDIDVGPDGNLYILSHNWNITDHYSQKGSIFKISKVAQESYKENTSEQTWTNYNNDILSVATETTKPLSGNGSLKVEIRPTTVTQLEGNYSWKVISTDFISVEGNASYDYSIDVSAKDVNQLHSKVKYYDSNKNEIKEDFIFSGRDGTFEDTFSNSLLSPDNAKYVKIQMWVQQSFERPASYLIDNVELKGIGS